MEAQEVIGNLAQIALPLALAAFINETYKGLIAGLTPARKEYMEITTWLNNKDNISKLPTTVLDQLKDRQSRLGVRLEKETHISWWIVIPLLMMIGGLIAIVSTSYVGPGRTESQAALSAVGGIVGAIGAVVSAAGMTVRRPRKKRS